MGSRNKKKSTRVQQELERQKAPGLHIRQSSEVLPPHATPIGRLQHVWQDFPFDKKIVDQAMRFTKGGLFFCDSTVFLAPTPPLLWDAMTRGNSIALIPCIAAELKVWIEDDKPSTNAVAHALVKACLSGNKECGIKWIPKPQQEWIADSVNYYANLLGVRKLMWHIAEDQVTKNLERPPTSQEISNYIQQFGTSRAQLLAKQGRDPKVPDHIYYDEWLVATALIYAITSTTEVTIVTSDEAVLDQFFQATLLLLRHYQAMLLAVDLVDSPESYQTERVDNPDREMLKGEKITIIKGLPDSAESYLPSDYYTINVHCMLLQSQVTRCTFRADCEMKRTLQMKHKTGGLSTDLLDGKNFHFITSQKVRARHKHCAVIAEDITVDAGGAIPLAHTDIQYALANVDSFSEVKHVDSRVLLLPQGYRE